LAVANLTASAVSLAAIELGGGKLLLSTEDPRYGGSRGQGLPADQPPGPQILPHELLVFDSHGEGP
jgi:hypothetical protein